ncbi:MAG: hypothetical protein ACTSVV_08860, partial [Promethearchaeota archaeon]
MKLPNQFINNGMNCVMFIEDDVDINKIEYKEDILDNSYFICKIIISKNIKDFKEVFMYILKNFTDNVEIKRVVSEIYYKLIEKNKIVYLDDYSLILYSILETIGKLTSYKNFLFIFCIDSMDDTKFFRELFSFFHGCIDFYQVNPTIKFKLVMRETMRDFVFKDTFPQLYDRLEVYSESKINKNVVFKNQNPFFMYCTSPNIYLWNNDSEWREKIVKLFSDELPIVKKLLNKIDLFRNQSDTPGLIVYASYGLGKSTAILLAINYCIKNYSEFILPIYIYLHNIPKYDKAELIIKEIVLQILTKINISLINNHLNTLTLSNNENFISILRKIFENIQKKIILFIDEFDVLQTNPSFNQIEKEKLAKFIYELQCIPNVNTIIFSIPNAKSYFNYKEFQVFFKIEEFEPLNNDEIENLLNHFSKHFEIKINSKDIVNEIHKLTIGLPRLIIKILKICLDKLGDNEKPISKELIKEIIKDYWNIDSLPNRIKINGDFIIINEARKKILNVLLIEMPDQMGTARQIAEKMNDPDISTQKVAANLTSFVKFELLNKIDK